MRTIALDITPLKNWLPGTSRPLIISGPCGAETEEQVLTTAHELAALNKVSIFRAGIWKPRTRPGSFQGIGSAGLQWLKKVKQETGLLTAVEVANANHVREALTNGIDILWIGARTTVNPFSVQEIADSLKGLDIPVIVKNPINADLELWIGALERINQAGITKLIAVHRGFHSGTKTKYRNNPHWEIPIELKTLCPPLPLLCDPSHICGRADLLEVVSQKAIDLDMDGLMIESHIDPYTAWSDSEQQITPSQLNNLLSNLIYREKETANKEFKNQLHELRAIIDKKDEELLQVLAARMEVIAKIGEYKRDNNVTILQIERWMEILKTRTFSAGTLGLSDSFVKTLLEIIHQESIRKQTEIMNEKITREK